MSSESYAQQIDVKTIWLKQFRDSGKPTIDLFEIRDSQIDLSVLKDGGVVLQLLCFSVDPYLSLQIKTNGRTKTEGEQPMSGIVSGKVILSRSNKWRKGDLFGARMQFSTFLLVQKEEIEKATIWKLTEYITEKQISKGVGVLGMTGCTAYVGVVDILQPKQGDTLFISAASGAVGHLVSQISKIFGVKTVIGSCGNDEKCEKLKSSFGFDYAVNYKTLGNDKAALVKELKKASPDGIDLYFDNVGGIHFDAAVEVMKSQGKVAICGLIESYHEKERVLNKVPLMDVLYKQLTIRGFLCFDWLLGKEGEKYFLEDMSKWMKEGKIEDCETIVNCIDSWSEAFCSLFSSGSNHIGKLVVMV